MNNLSNFSELDVNSLDSINGGSWKTKAAKYAYKAAKSFAEGVAGGIAWYVGEKCSE